MPTKNRFSSRAFFGRKTPKASRFQNIGIVKKVKLTLQDPEKYSRAHRSPIYFPLRQAENAEIRQLGGRAPLHSSQQNLQ